MQIRILVLVASVASAIALQLAVDPDDPAKIAEHPEMLALADRISTRNARRGLSGNTLSAQDKQDILQLHNKVRAETARGKYQCMYSSCAMGSNMQKLQWSDALADVASEWSSKCKFEHRQNSKVESDHCAQALASRKSQIDFDGYKSGSSCGENLAASGAGPSWSMFATNGATGKQQDFGMAGMIENGWSKEEADKFDLGDGWKFGHGTGHFTQVVWGATRYVGCGISYCSGKTGADPSWMRALLTCNYFPPGNYNGQRDSAGQVTPASQQPYRPGKPCTHCDAGQSCTNGETHTTQSVSTPAPTHYDLSGLCSGGASGKASSPAKPAPAPQPPKAAPAPAIKYSGKFKGKSPAELDAELGIKREKRCSNDLVAMPRQYTMSGFNAYPRYGIDINGVYTWEKCRNGGSQYGKGNILLVFWRSGFPAGGTGWTLSDNHGYLGIFRGGLAISFKPASQRWQTLNIQSGRAALMASPANALVCDGYYYKC